jgi:hypothetical protein
MRRIGYWIIGFAIIATLADKSHAASVVGSAKYSAQEIP